MLTSPPSPLPSHPLAADLDDLRARLARLERSNALSRAKVRELEEDLKAAQSQQQEQGEHEELEERLSGEMERRAGESALYLPRSVDRTGKLTLSPPTHSPRSDRHPPPGSSDAPHPLPRIPRGIPLRPPSTTPAPYLLPQRRRSSPRGSHGPPSWSRGTTRGSGACQGGCRGVVEGEGEGDGVGKGGGGEEGRDERRERGRAEGRGDGQEG